MRSFLFFLVLCLVVVNVFLFVNLVETKGLLDSGADEVVPFSPTCSVPEGFDSAVRDFNQGL